MQFYQYGHGKKTLNMARDFHNSQPSYKFSLQLQLNFTVRKTTSRQIKKHHFDAECEGGK